MNTNDPDRNDGFDISTINRRRVLKGVGVAGAVGVLGTGPATARHQDRGPQEKCACIDDPDTEAWGKYDFDSDACEFVHSEGEDIVTIDYDPTDPDQNKEGEVCEPIAVDYTVADGYVVSYVCSFGGTDNHDDGNTDGTYVSNLTNPGGQTAAISNLTFCVEEEPDLPPGELLGWQVDLIHGEPIENLNEDTSDTYSSENRLLQALWADPEDPTGRLEDQHFAQNDDAYADCDANIVQDITFDPDTGLATATLDPGVCDCADFDLVSYDAPDYEWQGGQDQIFHQSAQQESTVEEDGDGNCVFTVEVPYGGGD